MIVFVIQEDFPEVWPSAITDVMNLITQPETSLKGMLLLYQTIKVLIKVPGILSFLYIFFSGRFLVSFLFFFFFFQRAIFIYFYIDEMEEDDEEQSTLREKRAKLGELHAEQIFSLLTPIWVKFHCEMLTLLSQFLQGALPANEIQISSGLFSKLS